MNNEHTDKLEQRIRFVAKHYREKALDVDAAWKRFAAQHPMEARRHTLSRRAWIEAAAAILLLLVGVGTYFLAGRERAEWIAISTTAGERKEVLLPDSTEVSLAANSSIRYDRKSYGKERRAVEMNGKAFFQVKRNEARPFSVTTALATATVLGTSFQVTADRKTAEVLVATGKVRFAAKESRHESVVLTAGMGATYSKEREELTVDREADTNELAWKTGVLHFNDTPLEEVIARLDDYYGVTIRNRNTSTKGLKLTATFDKLPLGEVLLVINQTLDTRLSASTPTR